MGEKSEIQVDGVTSKGKMTVLLLDACQRKWAHESYLELGMPLVGCERISLANADQEAACIERCT